MEPLERRELLDVSAAITRGYSPIAEDGGECVFKIECSGEEAS